jgi:hypothetical protein
MRNPASLQPGMHGDYVIEHLKLNGASALDDPFPFTAFADIKLNAKERNYIVKGLLPRSGLAVVWGPPKSGKAFGAWMCFSMLRWNGNIAGEKCSKPV